MLSALVRGLDTALSKDIIVAILVRYLVDSGWMMFKGTLDNGSQDLVNRFDVGQYQLDVDSLSVVNSWCAHAPSNHKITVHDGFEFGSSNVAVSYSMLLTSLRVVVPPGCG